MEPFLRRGTLLKPNYISFLHISQPLRATGGTSQTVVHIERTCIFVLLSPGFWELDRRRIHSELLLSFVVRHFPNVSN